MTTDLEVQNVKDKGDNYLVNYFYEGSEVIRTLRRKDLIEFIVEEGLNLIQLYDYKLEDIDQKFVNPGEYLDENYREVVSNYLKYHLA